MEKEQIISSGLLELYVMGVASPGEMAQVEKWRLQYPQVNTEIINIEQALENYAQAEAIVPSDTIKQKIFASLHADDIAENIVAIDPVFTQQSTNPLHAVPSGSDQKPSKGFNLSPLSRVAAAAAILILLTSNIFYYNKYRNAQEQNAEGQQQLAELNSRYTDMDRDMNIVQSKYSKPVALDGMEAAPDAAAKIFWMKNTGEVYVDPGNMPMAPSGKQYQLWAFVDGKPVDAGMISSADGKKYSIQRMKTFGKAEAFAITLETSGGNPQPKGSIYVMGKI